MATTPVGLGSPASIGTNAQTRGDPYQSKVDGGGVRPPEENNGYRSNANVTPGSSGDGVAANNTGSGVHNRADVVTSDSFGVAGSVQGHDGLSAMIDAQVAAGDAARAQASGSPQGRAGISMYMDQQIMSGDAARAQTSGGYPQGPAGTSAYLANLSAAGDAARAQSSGPARMDEHGVAVYFTQNGIVQPNSGGGRGGGPPPTEAEIAEYQSQLRERAAAKVAKQHALEEAERAARNLPSEGELNAMVQAKTTELGGRQLGALTRVGLAVVGQVVVEFPDARNRSGKRTEFLALVADPVSRSVGVVPHEFSRFYREHAAQLGVTQGDAFVVHGLEWMQRFEKGTLAYSQGTLKIFPPGYTPPPPR